MKAKVKNKKTVVISFRVPSDLKKDIKKYNLDVSIICRDAIVEQIGILSGE